MSAELLFGLSIPSGGVVSDDQFAAFVAASIAPAFPVGFTVLPAKGAWRDPQGHTIAEGARLVLIIAPDTADTAAKLHSIRTAYRAQFHQQSVGLITVQSCASW